MAPNPTYVGVYTPFIRDHSLSPNFMDSACGISPQFYF